MLLGWSVGIPWNFSTTYFLLQKKVLLYQYFFTYRFSMAQGLLVVPERSAKVIYQVEAVHFLAANSQTHSLHGYLVGTRVGTQTHQVNTTSLIGEETLPFYRPGQLYPVYIGELLDSRYKVLGKLGYGIVGTTLSITAMVNINLLSLFFFL